MAGAGLLTVLAICGICAGVLAGKTQRFSAYLGAVGGGLLVGIAWFWLIPEISHLSGTATAVLLVLSVALLLLGADRFLLHYASEHKKSVITPLLLATSAHSFLDGWSIRALSVDPFAQWPVFAGLALHKIPEGIALGWITRRSFSSVAKALFISGGIELFTLIGALAEGRSSGPGLSAFGLGWDGAVLAIVAGSFTFIGLHTLLPLRRSPAVVTVFIATLLVVAGVALWRR